MLNFIDDVVDELGGQDLVDHYIREIDRRIPSRQLTLLYSFMPVMSSYVNDNRPYLKGQVVKFHDNVRDSISSKLQRLERAGIRRYVREGGMFFPLLAEEVHAVYVAAQELNNVGVTELLREIDSYILNSHNVLVNYGGGIDPLPKMVLENLGNQSGGGPGAGATDVSAKQLHKILKGRNPALVVVKFYAPWCGYCERFAPEYDAFADRVSQATKHRVLKVNMDTASNKKALENTEIARLVTGFPTVLFFKKRGKGRDIQIYGGERTAEGLLEACEA